MAQSLLKFNIDTHNDVIIRPQGNMRVTRFTYLDWFNLNGKVGNNFLYEHRFLNNQFYCIDEDISIIQDHILTHNTTSPILSRSNYIKSQLYLQGGFYNMDNIYEILRVPIDQNEYDLIMILLFGPEFIKIYG